MKFPFVQQHDSRQCGVACLSMICRYYGRVVTLQQIECMCDVSKEGISLKGIQDAAGDLGLRSMALKLTVSQLSEIQLPCILHWNQNHFVVLYKIDRDGRRFWIADPWSGRKKLSLAELEKSWVSTSADGESQGVALVMDKTPQFDTNEITGSEKRSFKFLWQYFVRYRRYFMQIALALVLGCLFQLIMPFLTQWIVDMGITHQNIRIIWLILLGELMIVLGRTATGFIRRWLLLHISMRINISLVSDFFIKLLKLPMSFFDRKHLGDLLQRMGDHGRIQSFLTNQILSVVFSVLSFVVFGAVLLIYDRLIFAVFALSTILYGFWIAHFLRRRRLLDYESFEVQATNQNLTYQLITSMQEIKLQDCERRRRWEWEDAQADLFGIQMKTLKLQQTQEAGSIFINELKNVLITVLAATAVVNGQITLGAMLAVQYIVGQLNSPVEQLMQFVYSIQDVKISMDRINEIHQAGDEESYQRPRHEFGQSKSMELCNLNFKYDRHALKNTLSDISLAIPEGAVTAIVGASGSGKTTLIKLLLGYYPTAYGTVKLSGMPLDEYDLKWWRQRCGVVMQEGIIFSESIKRNIAVDDRAVDNDRMIEAARIANIHDFVMSLPLKYDTRIGHEGMGLSQGQKQRILIARAVYKNPDFIFLDEATNALDAKNEKEIVANLATFYRGKTVVVVAHRLSTVRHADQIVVLNEGRVAETGTHNELVKKRNIYYELIKNQLELGQ